MTRIGSKYCKVCHRLGPMICMNIWYYFDFIDGKVPSGLNEEDEQYVLTGICPKCQKKLNKKRDEKNYVQ